MLRTSLRKWQSEVSRPVVSVFLSSNAQDFIEDDRDVDTHDENGMIFLSSNAQDFIEERVRAASIACTRRFLSSNAQDFIEEVSPEPSPVQNSNS